MSLRILFVLPYIPNLIRVRSNNFIRSLAARGHEISLLAVDDGSGEPADLESIREVCHKVEVVRLTRIQSAWNLLRGLPDSTPMQAAYAWHPRAILPPKPGSLLEGLSSNFDVIHIEHLRAAKYGIAIKELLREADAQVPIIYDSVDCISALFRLTMESAARPVNRLIARLELGRTEKYESALLDLFDGILVTSVADQEKLQALNGQLHTLRKIFVVPNGVDLEYFHINGREHSVPIIIMTGKMSYHANVTMVNNFVTGILPLIWQSKPEVRLLIVGKDPPKRIQALSRDPRIEVTGSVPDIRMYFEQASVAVVPLTYGMGIQNKVLEAMACSIPVVATSTATKALRVQHGHDLLLADRASDFARTVLDLLDHPEKRRSLGQAGREYVVKHHDWVSISQTLEELYRRVIVNKN